MGGRCEKSGGGAFFVHERASDVFMEIPITIDDWEGVGSWVCF